MDKSVRAFFVRKFWNMRVCSQCIPYGKMTHSPVPQNTCSLVRLSNTIWSDMFCLFFHSHCFVCSSFQAKRFTSHFPWKSNIIICKHKPNPTHNFVLRRCSLVLHAEVYSTECCCSTIFIVSECLCRVFFYSEL